MLMQGKTPEEQTTTPNCHESCGKMEPSQREYYEMFHNLPLKAIIPACELLKPGGVVFTEQNIHLIPFGCNMIPLAGDGKKKIKFELKRLKQEAGKRDAVVPLELIEKASKNEENECAFCNGPGMSKCQNCMSASYCCRDHQLADWKVHRPFCVLHEVVRDHSDGFYIAAKTNIKKGELIFIEEPFFISPFSTDEHFHLLKFQPVSDENQNLKAGTLTVEEFQTNVCTFPTLCIGCSVYLSSEEDYYYLCECGWPLCGENCVELYRHRKWECCYLKARMIVFEEFRKVAVLSPRMIGVVRALILKERDPENWEIISDDIRHSTWAEHINADPSSRLNVEYLLVVLRNAFHFEQLQYSELINILAFIDIKGVYGCLFEQHGELCRRVSCVYQAASMIRHQCVGNVFTIQTSSGSLHVIAARNIKRGEPLYRNYNAQGELQHVTLRQEFARSITGKPCECVLCVKLEAGENSLSAILCLKCKRRGLQSYMMVETPATYDSSWKCHRCGATKSSQQVRNLLQDITKDLQYFEPNGENRTFEDILRSCIARYKGIVLHPQHALILGAEFDMIFYMMEGGRMASLHPEDVEYLIQLLNTRISNLKKVVTDAHSSLVSMKIRLANVLFHQARRGYVGGSRELLKTFEDLQFIHDDIVESFVEHTRPNALHGYILNCSRKMRTLIAEIVDVFNEQRRRLNQSMKYSSLYKAVDNLAITSSSYSEKNSRMEGLGDGDKSEIQTGK